MDNALKHKLEALSDHHVLWALAFLSKQPVGEITKAEAIEKIEWWIENFGPGFERRLDIYLDRE